MEQEIIIELKEKILLEKKKLEKELNQVAQADPHSPSHYEASFPQYGDEEEENAAEVGAFTTNISLEKILTSSLRDIDNALKRIEENTYGICKYCNKEIDSARLRARPASSACISCKKRLTKEK